MNERVIPEAMASMLRLIMPDGIGNLVVEVNEIAGIPAVTEDQRYGFTLFHDYFTNPQPDWVTELRQNERSMKWYLRLAEGLFGHTQGARKAVEYHLCRIGEIESEVETYLGRQDLSKIPKGSCHAIGNTQKLDVEYHAFVYAYRRTLEYFAAGLAAYFRTECNSFKDLPKALNRPKAAPEIHEPLLQVYEKHKPSFDFVLSSENGRSVRDTISHYEFVPAGIFNLTCEGFRLVGGGENLAHSNSPGRLCDVLSERTAILDAYLNESLTAFTDALRAHH
ncbi:hypothetical protein NL64_13265 [Pseudomonas fluorescens]|uniref:hypothetical protein n=1 Tax=Pseudomonas fluorescens TaxID=294 RepID=UPI00054B8770|nr:hypothetical protein [Pseudomonas fluorescens]KII32207.1 hypothetical protein NL64_13265 [Pseudomonas fluorescens]